MHYHRILFDKYHPGYFGKVKIKAKASPTNAPMINVIQFGCFKVLGKGVLPQSMPIVVKAKIILKTAEEKIKEAGGTIVFTT
ncbi:hypothetical protein ACSBR1_036853 [Camellia fascicularis]